MGCVNVLTFSFVLATVAVIVGLALPKWYEERWPDHHKEAFTKGNLWRVCFYHPMEVMMDVTPGMDIVMDNKVCDHTLTVFKNNDYYKYQQAMIGLVGCGLCLALVTLGLYLLWALQINRDSREAGNKVHRSGLIAALFGFLSGVCIIAMAILFSLTLDEITTKSVNKEVAYWLTVAGGAIQTLVALCTAGFMFCRRNEGKYLASDVDIMMDSHIQTIHVIEDQNNSRA